MQGSELIDGMSGQCTPVVPEHRSTDTSKESGLNEDLHLCGVLTEGHARTFYLPDVAFLVVQQKLQATVNWRCTHFDFNFNCEQHIGGQRFNAVMVSASVRVWPASEHQYSSTSPYPNCT